MEIWAVLPLPQFVCSFAIRHLQQRSPGTSAVSVLCAIIKVDWMAGICEINQAVSQEAKASVAPLANCASTTLLLRAPKARSHKARLREALSHSQALFPLSASVQGRVIPGGLTEAKGQ